MRQRLVVDWQKLQVIYGSANLQAKNDEDGAFGVEGNSGKVKRTVISTKEKWLRSLLTNLIASGQFVISNDLLWLLWNTRAWYTCLARGIKRKRMNGISKLSLISSIYIHQHASYTAQRVLVWREKQLYIFFLNLKDAVCQFFSSIKCNSNLFDLTFWQYS